MIGSGISQGRVVKERSTLVILPMMVGQHCQSLLKMRRTLLGNSCGVLRKKLSLPFVQGINIYKMYFDLFPVTKKNRESFIVWNLGPRPIDKLRSINFAFAQPADGAIFLGN